MTWVLSAVGLALVGGDGQCFPQILTDILFRRKNSCFELIGGGGGGSHISPLTVGASRPFCWVLVDNGSSRAQQQSPSAFPSLCLEAPRGSSFG